MFEDPLLLVVMLVCFAVLVILMFGIGTFGRGGDFNRKHANKIMRWRLGAQFLAIIVIMTVIYIRGTGGQ